MHECRSLSASCLPRHLRIPVHRERRRPTGMWEGRATPGAVAEMRRSGRLIHPTRSCLVDFHAAGVIRNNHGIAADQRDMQFIEPA